MKMTTNMLMVMALVLYLAGSASAWDGWAGGGGVGDWGTGANWTRGFAPAHLGESTGWDGGNIPASDVDITIDQAGAFGNIGGDRDYATLGGPFFARTVMRGDLDVNIDFTIPASSIGIEVRDEWWMRAGSYAKNTTIHMEGSVITIDATGTLRVGGGDAAAQSHIQLDGGLIDILGILDLRSNGSIDITGGTLVVAGNFAPNANITGYGGAGIVNYVEAGGSTTITAAIPEPATAIMLVMGLSGLAMIRRKR